MLNRDDATLDDAERAKFNKLPLLECFSEADIERLLKDARMLEYGAGDVLVEEGEEANAAYYVVDGELDILRRIGSDNVAIATRRTGEIVGEMSLLIGEPRTATIRARVLSRVLEISHERLHETLLCNPESMFLMLRTVAARLKHSESSLVHYQKLAGLGTMAAGLAHELNNPAAAIVRGAMQLEESVLAWECWSESLGSLSLSAEQRHRIDELRHGARAGHETTQFGDEIERFDAQDALRDWLERKHVGSAAALAVSLVDSGHTVDVARRIEEQFGPEHLETVLNWIAARETSFSILQSLRASGKAISEIVGGVKSFTRLDQAPVQDVDVHEGLEQTLTVLRYRLGKINVHRMYAHDLPRITAFASELNQVWANLIDNAVDAMDGQGDITIRTSAEEKSVVVEITDTGRGIPIEAQQHLFDPFFTTKPVGKGTGLGLSISNNIVRKHGGDITYQTRPGQTTFVVRLPHNGGRTTEALSDHGETSDKQS